MGARIRLTIGAKLVGLIAVVLMSSIASLVWLSSRMYVENDTALIQNINADTAGSLAARMREFFDTTTEKMRVLGTILVQNPKLSEKQQLLVDEFFKKDKDFLGLFVNLHAEDNKATIVGRAVSPELGVINDPNGDLAVAALNGDKQFSPELAAKGAVLISVIKLSDSNPAIAVTVPFIANDKGFSHTLTAVIRQSRFMKVFGETDVVTAFLVDNRGKLLAHPDANRVLASESMTHLEIVRKMIEGKYNNGQTRYVDPQIGEYRLGAYRLVGFGGLGVVAEVPESKAFEAANQVQRRSFFIAIIVLSISFLAGYLYSGTITWPIKQLVAAAKRISEGDFNIRLKPKSRDEVATLSFAFNDMAKGLEERDRVKEVFNKFHNKEVAEKLMAGEVKLGGERKNAVIFFSDVRGFTAMSESMQPEEVVEMLNEYMTEMVAVVRNHHGIIDKYVGDAIMALWGVPIEGENDAYQAVRACLEMRVQLAKLNEKRISRNQPVLRIGMGVNVGSVIAGNIGSNEKMEYTVIGDSVNLASRIESMTKTYGTDLLLSHTLYEKVKDRFIFESCESAMVKGKSQAVEVYKVRGYFDDAGKEVIVETPYSSYAAEHCDKVKRPEKPTLVEVPKETEAPKEVVPPPFKKAASGFRNL
jgi:adenylate cyclase